jgi:hypothetical protein
MAFEKRQFVNSSFYLNDAFKKQLPFAAGKIGNCELICIYNYFFFQHKNKPVQWFPNVIDEMYNNAGIFPQTENARVEYINELVTIMPQIDALAWWSMFNLDFEARFIKKHSPDCQLIELGSLDPFYSGSPWSEHLKGKKVLVISPFSESVKNQYTNRNKIWNDPRILPDFELLTINHPYSPGIDENPYSNWLEMITDIKKQIDTFDYDVLLAGTGATSLFYAVHAKTNGKIGMHLGGSMQLLFGIKGKRWDNGEVGQYFYNDGWVRPLTKEIPKKFQNIEGGCYW